MKAMGRQLWRALIVLVILLDGGSARAHPALALLREAESAAARGQRTHAESAYRQALDALATPYPALRLAQLYTDWGRPQEARALLETARQLGADPDTINELTLPALLALQAWDEAYALAQHHRERHPESHAAWQAIAHVLSLREMCVQARQESEAWYAALPADPEARQVWAVFHLTDDLATARTLLCAQDEGLCHSLDTCTDATACALSLGAALLNQRQWALALCLLRPIVTANPHHATAQAWLGAALIQEQRYQEARQALDQALRLKPEQPLAWSLLGLLQLQEADYPGAEVSLFQAHRLDPGNPAPCLALARLYALQSRYEQVDVWTNAALDRAGEDVAVWQSVARFYLERSQSSPVLERALRGSLEQAPDAPETLLLQGWQALLKGDGLTARRWLEQAVARDASRGEAWYLYGVALEMTGAEARPAFIRARDAGYTPRPAPSTGPLSLP